MTAEASLTSRPQGFAKDNDNAWAVVLRCCQMLPATNDRRQQFATDAGLRLRQLLINYCGAAFRRCLCNGMTSLFVSMERHRTTCYCNARQRRHSDAASAAATICDDDSWRRSLRLAAAIPPPPGFRSWTDCSSRDTPGKLAVSTGLIHPSVSSLR
jgi:hypothetical protein